MNKIILKVPPEMHLGAHTFKVVLDHHIRDDDRAAVLKPRVQRIAFDPSMPSSLRTENMFHEALEWVYRVWNISIEHDDIERLGCGLAEFFVRNFNIEFDWSDIPEVEG